MPVSRTVAITGSASLKPVTPTSAPFPSLSETLTLNLEQTRGIGRGQAISIASPAAFVDLLAGLGITTATMVVIRIRSGFLTIRCTTAAGVDQVIDCSELWAYSSPLAGREITALAVQGTADIEMIVAGD